MALDLVVVKRWLAQRFIEGRFPEFAQSLATILGSGWGMSIQVMTWAALLTLVGLFVSACASSGHHTSPSATRSGAPWAQDLNEPPPRREPANAAQIKADLTAAREKASRPR
jgi:hypothetical protein